MTAVGDVELDLVERCRSGDRTAFRALVAFWGDPALRLATTLTNDDGRARTAIAGAFGRCWAELPSLHSSIPFRPYVLNLVARAAAPHGSSGGTGKLERCLDLLDADARAAVVLSAQGDLRAHDIARAQGVGVIEAVRTTRASLRSLQTCLGSEPANALRAAFPHMHLEHTFFDDVLEPSLEDRSALEVRRIVQRPPHDTWGVLTDPTTLAAWVSAERAHVRGGGSIRAGGHIVARGRIADRRRSTDRSIVTIVDPPSLLAWTTRSHVRPVREPIELRWSIAIVETPGGSELHHRLRGVAFPRGMSGRYLRAAYVRVADGMQASMHRGVERLAALVEASTR
jgi:uncharacterized protein YndB with AHSA1/START domain